MIVSAPKIIAAMTGAATGDDQLTTSFTTKFALTQGAWWAKLRIRHAQADSTSITLRILDYSDTSMTGSAGGAPLLSTRQSAVQSTSANAAIATGPNAGGHTGATATYHVLLAADPADDVIWVELRGGVDKILVDIKRSGGTAIAGNAIQVEARTVETQR